MQKNGHLLITLPDGTQVKFGQECITGTENESVDHLPKLYLNPERGRKLDAIRIINVFAEMNFVLDENGKKAMKKDIFQWFGTMLNTDFTNYNNNLSSSLADGSSMKKHLKIFEEMQEKMKSIFNIH